MNETEAFIKVVRAGGFADASRAWGVPRSTMSRQVARLEDRLGVQLLHRTTRSIGLTEAGRAYFERCGPAVDAIADAAREARTYLDGPRGVLTVSLPFDAARDLLGPTLSAFHKRYPDVSLRLRIDSRRVNLVAEGVDVAIRGGRMEDSSLIARLILTSDLYFYASPDYLERAGEPKSLKDLETHERLAFAGPPTGWPVQTPQGQARVPIDGWLVLNEWHTLAQCTADGGGIALILDTMAQPFVRLGRLTQVLHDHKAWGGGMYAVYPSAQRLSPKVRVFVDFLVEHSERWAAR